MIRLSEHFRALREAGLIRGERRGVEMYNTSRCAEVERRFPGLLRAIVNAHTIQFKDEVQAKKLAGRRSSRRSVKNKRQAAAICRLTSPEVDE
jgi:DNA-binding transcriptional ArsR family regulator